MADGTTIDPDVIVDLCATPEQQEMIQATEPFQVWEIARRYGKTLTLRNKLVKYGFEFPGFQFWYCALTYSKAKTEYHRFAKATAPFVTWKSLQPHPQINWFNGSEFRFLSMDRADNHRGEGVKLICCDEAAKFREQDVWEVLQPATADVDGQMVFSSTPYGVDNWFHKEFLKGKDPANIGLYRSFKYTTPEACWAQDEKGRARLERIRRSVPTVVWNQEYLCDPSQSSDAVFMFVERAIVHEPPRPASSMPVVLAWDLGGKADPSCVVVMDVDGFIIHVEMLPLGMEATFQLKRVSQIAERFSNIICIIDTHGTNRDWTVGFAAERLPNVREASFAPANKERMVRDLALAIEQGKIKIPAEFRELISQIRAYRYLRRRDHYDYRAPEGEKDDGVAALMMAWFAKISGWIGITGRPLTFN